MCIYYHLYKYNDNEGDDSYMVYYSSDYNKSNSALALELLMELLIDVYLTNDKGDERASETSDDKECSILKM